jgi:hypothetical protein
MTLRLRRPRKVRIQKAVPSSLLSCTRPATPINLRSPEDQRDHCYSSSSSIVWLMMISTTWRTSIVMIARGCQRMVFELTLVRRALPDLSGWPWRLACFRLTSCKVGAPPCSSTGFFWVRAPTRTDSNERTNAGEDRILSLIGMTGLELQMRNVLSHG